MTQELDSGDKLVKDFLGGVRGIVHSGSERASTVSGSTEGGVRGAEEEEEEEDEQRAWERDSGTSTRTVEVGLRTGRGDLDRRLLRPLDGIVLGEKGGGKWVPCVIRKCEG